MPGGDDKRDDDARSLARLGYAQELLRAMGGFSSFALSFSIISILTGITSTYGDALRGGGPAGVGLGWPIVSAGTLLVALAMGELASAFPTAGALYHWAALLGGAGWGWLTAMMNLVGQVAIVAAIDLTCAQTLAETLGLPPGAAYPLFTVVLASHAALNVVWVRVVAWLNDFSATVHVVGVVVLVALLFVFARVRPLGYLAETGFTTRADGEYALGFVNALVLGMWTFTGFDASAHVSEETHRPAVRAPWGIVSSVVVSAVAGYLLAIALTLAIHDLPEVAADPSPALFLLRRALGDTAGRTAMGMVIVAMWFCGLSSVTSASRMLFAFARDGGVPMADAIRRVSVRFRTPYVATLLAVCAPGALVAAVAVLRAVHKELAGSVFLAVASLATTALYTSYALPIALGVAARVRGRWRRLGPWNLGRAGVSIAGAAVLWCVFVLFVLGLPPNPLGTALLAAILVVLVVVYFVRVRGRFRGPKIDLEALEE